MKIYKLQSGEHIAVGIMADQQRVVCYKLSDVPGREHFEMCDIQQDKEGCPYFFYNHIEPVYLNAKLPRVDVEIRGGVAYVTKKPKGVELKVTDWDNVNEPECNQSINFMDSNTEV